MGAVVQLAAARERRDVDREAFTAAIKRVMADPKMVADRALDAAIIGAWPHRFLFNLVRERFFQTVEFHLLRQRLNGQALDYAEAVALTLHDTRHAVPDELIETRCMELLTQLAQESKT